jgi:hypothetical protein
MTVACVWVRGQVPYGVEYVERLAAMVRRRLPQPHRFVCFTDRPREVPIGVAPIAITPLARAGWWSKLELFNPGHGLTDRVLYLDLDVLVVGDLAPILEFPAAFATLHDDGSTFQPRLPHRVLKRFNSSVMVFDGGVYPDLWIEWHLGVADRLWGDQDWLAERHPEAATLPPAWCPRLSAFAATGIVPPAARVVLAKKPKNHIAAGQWPWFRDLWMGTR